MREVRRTVRARGAAGAGLLAAVAVCTAALAAGPDPGPAGAPTVGLCSARLAPVAADGRRVGGDTVPEAPRFLGDEIRVTVTRREEPLSAVPLAVSLREVGEREATERGVSLQELLGPVPGVTVQDRRNYSLGDRVTVRGSGARAQFGVRGVHLVADGIPLTLPDGQSVLTNLDLTSAGAVEVLRGPASALYGNAAGGVIRVRTRDPSPAVALRPRVVAGGHGFLLSAVEASGPLGTTRPPGESAAGRGWRLSLLRMETEGFRRHSRAEIYRGNLLLRFEPGPATEVRAVANGYRTPFAQNPSTLSREDARSSPRRARELVVSQGLGEEAGQLQGGATLRHRWSGGEEIVAAAWGLTRSVENPIPFRIIDLDRAAAGARVELHGRAAPTGTSVTWTAGVDGAVQDDDRREAENRGVPAGGGRAEGGDLLLAQAERVENVAPFLRATVRLSEGVRVTGTARHDFFRLRVDDRHLSDSDDSGTRALSRLSPGAGLAWSPSGSVTVYGNLATSFEIPTTSELSNRPSGEGGFNPELGPQTTRSLEAGARVRLPAAGLRGSVAAYRARVEGAILPFQGPEEEVFFRNAGEVERRGVELSAEWSPSPRLRAGLALTRQWNRYERFETADGDFSGNREAGVPDHVLEAEAAWRSPSGLAVRGRFRWRDEYPVNDANTAYDWTARVLDLRVSMDRAVGGARVFPFLGVDNALDERYNASVVPNAFGGRYYEPAPGRTLVGGMEVRAGPGGG